MQNTSDSDKDLKDAGDIKELSYNGKKKIKTLGKLRETLGSQDLREEIEEIEDLYRIKVR